MKLLATKALNDNIFVGTRNWNT